MIFNINRIIQELDLLSRAITGIQWVTGLTLLIMLTGCLSPIALNRAVIAYDDAVTDVVSQQLLINIVRAHHRQPIHFTGVSNIAATFTFQASAGAAPAAAVKKTTVEADADADANADAAAAAMTARSRTSR